MLAVLDMRFFYLQLIIHSLNRILGELAERRGKSSVQEVISGVVLEFHLFERLPLNMRNDDEMRKRANLGEVEARH